MTVPFRALAVLTGILLAATAAVDIPHDQAAVFVSPVDHLLEALFALALASATTSLIALLRAASSWLPRAGWVLAAIGTAILTLVAGATFVNGRESLDGLFPVGLLGVALGYLVLVVADLRRRTWPRFAGLVLAGGFVAMIALGEGLGLLAWSASWFAVATLASPAPIVSPVELGRA